MAVTNTEISNTINKAQQKIAELGYDIALKELRGEECEDIWLQLRYLSGGIDVLQSDVDDLTTANKEQIVQCMISIGDLQKLSTVAFSFKTLHVVVNDLTGTYLGLTDTDDTYTNHKCKVPVVNANENALEFLHISVGSSNLIVSPNGDDSRAEKGSMVCHYKTVTAAETAATSGDTIVVYPDIYELSTSSLGKDGITWHLMEGVLIRNATSGGGDIFDMSSGTKTIVVGGHGHILQRTDGKYVANINDAGSKLTLSGKLENDYNNASGHVLLKGAGTMILKECDLIVANTSAYPVSATGGAQDVKIYEARSNSAGQDANITYLINNIELDSNIE